MFSKIKNHHIILKILGYLGSHDYDLPLNQNEDSRFLILLVGLMSFLAVLACSGTFALNAMVDRWSSGLENKVTIEISIETRDGRLLSNSTVKRETGKLYRKLSENPLVKSVKILTAEEIRELISPWIGSDLTLNDIPLPGLIALEIQNSDKQNMEALKKDIEEISKYARLETHNDWLSDLINFANTLKILSLLVVLVIGGATVIAVIAGIRARLAVHHKEIELLHNMGANDDYIARQFQRHAMILSFKGTMVGTLSGLIVVAVIMLLSKNFASPLVPSIETGYAILLLFFAIPAIIVLIAVITSRFTVLYNLSKMP